MLTNLHLQNFKCFQNLLLPLAPLTLLTGFNGAGKSSALQSLLLLAQTLRSDCLTTKSIPLSGDLVKLGTVGEVLNETTNSREMMFQVENHGSQLAWKIKIVTRAEHKLTIHQVNEVAINDELLSNLLPSALRTPANLALIDTLQHLVFVSAIRLGTAEVFPSPKPADNLIHAEVGILGEFAAWWFDSYKEDAVDQARCHPAEARTSLLAQVNAWANELFPHTEFDVQRIDMTDLVRLQLRIGKTSNWRRPSNIGYGLTYAFPILVAGLLAKPGQLVMIDSPEAHLHPSGQSKIGQFLGRMANAGIQVIMETHSDHVLNGIRIAIKEKWLQPDKVAFHFFTPGDEQTEVITPMIDDNGRLDRWPEGFFDETAKNLASLAAGQRPRFKAPKA
jgi:predicted ATPase